MFLMMIFRFVYILKHLLSNKFSERIKSYLIFEAKWKKMALVIVNDNSDY